MVGSVKRFSRFSSSSCWQAFKCSSVVFVQHCGFLSLLYTSIAFVSLKSNLVLTVTFSTKSVDEAPVFLILAANL